MRSPATPGPDRGTSTRQRLIDAGWQELDELPLPRAFAGATTAAVARRAGVTTGAFFHHFPDAVAFAAAMARDLGEDGPELPPSLDELVPQLADADVVQLLRDAMDTSWKRLHGDPERARRLRNEMLLWSHHRCEVPGPDGGPTEVAELLRHRYNAREDPVNDLWSALLRRVDRTLVEPFTPKRLAVGLTALFQGLALRHAVDPDAVDDDLFPDLVSVLVATLSQPAGDRRRVADVAAPLYADLGRSPQARSGARRRLETRRRVLGAAAGMFATGWEHVTASDVAERAGVSTQTVSNQFRGVRNVAAATFADHVDDVVEAAEGHPDEPVEALRAALRALAEAAGADRAPARALLGERLATAVKLGGHLAEDDIRTEVPVARVVLPLLAGMDLGDADLIDLNTTLIDFVLGHAIVRPGRAAETAELALRLLPTTATALGAQRSDQVT